MNVLIFASTLLFYVLVLKPATAACQLNTQGENESVGFLIILSGFFD